MMQACTYNSHNARPTITTQKIPIPNTSNEILVKIHAAAINPIVMLLIKVHIIFYLTLNGHVHLGLILLVL